MPPGARGLPGHRPGNPSLSEFSLVQRIGAVSMPLHLHDLKRAWDAQDAELVHLIESPAVQPDQPPEAPVREGAPTVERFLAELRGWQFRRKSKEEQAHFRVEQWKALEAPDAEVPLP